MHEQGDCSSARRERAVRLWFEMWLKQQDLGISEIFAEDVVYTESWGPEYAGSAAVKHWFDEWNTRGRVLVWDIGQFFHKGSETLVTWYFKNEMNTGAFEEFDGVSRIEWTKDGKIRALQEYGCNRDRYDPYRHGDPPQFRAESAKWF